MTDPPALPGEVWHVTSQFPPATHGGLGTHVAALTDAFPSAVSVRVLGPAGGRMGRHPYAALPAEDSPDALRDWAASLPGDASPALIHAHNYEAAGAALALAGRFRCPLVTTVHLAAPPRARKLEEDLLRRSDLVLTVSRWQSDQVSRLFPGVEPRVVANGVDAAVFHPAIGGERRDLLYAGRLCPGKGVELAIATLAYLATRYPALRLRVAGTGPWERAFRNRARELGVPDRVDWLGWLEPEVLAEEYRRAEAVLLPGENEPFGLTSLEAMACGAAVISCGSGGTGEFLTDGRNGWERPEPDAAVWAGAVQEILAGGPGVEQVRRTAAADAAELSWSRAAAETLAAYRSIL